AAFASVARLPRPSSALPSDRRGSEHGLPPPVGPRPVGSWLHRLRKRPTPGKTTRRLVRSWVGTVVAGDACSPQSAILRRNGEPGQKRQPRPGASTGVRESSHGNSAFF